MTVERTIQGIRVTDMINGEYKTFHYIGYTKKEAIAEFKQEFKADYKKEKQA